LNVILTGVALMASVMVSYTTARSEGLGVKANVGFLQRPERVVLLIIGALSTWDWNSDVWWFNRMPQVLWVLAVGSVWTLIHRMYYIWTEFKKIDEGTGDN
jgi:CDP-diacylglycerol--glycerol-3-phosphate 3-phosphatidyltransferase